MKEHPVYMLAFSPHPVDTEWGIAGTVASLTQQGKEVVYGGVGGILQPRTPRPII